MEIVYLSRDDRRYFFPLYTDNNFKVTSRIATLGNLEILKEKKLAFFCSVKCPGQLILKTYDLAQRLEEEGITLISGFHSPIRGKGNGTVLFFIKCLARISLAKPSASLKKKAERKLVEANKKLIEIYERKMQVKLTEIWGEG